MANPTRRAALGLLLSLAPGAALAARRRYDAPARGGIAVDVSPLRREGDNTDADYLAEVLPGYLRLAFGPGRDVRVRIDDVSYGAPGSNGGIDNNGAVDSIEGVGWVDGREVPLRCAIQTVVAFPDVGGYAARTRQDQLARSFAQWLPRESGSWR